MSASPRFTREEFATRVARVQDELERRGLGAVVATTAEDILWLTGYASFGGYQLQAALLRTEDGEPALWLHEMEAGWATATGVVSEVTGWAHADGDPATQLGGWLARRLPSGVSLGMNLENAPISAGVRDRLASHVAGVELIDASDLIAELRAIKSHAELGRVREAAAFADAGMEAVARRVTPGRSELDFLSAIQVELNTLGSEPPAVPYVVLSGDRSVLGHQPPSGRRLEASDRAIVEVVGVSARYHANVSRTLVTGSTSALFEDLCATVIHVLGRCIDTAGPGVAGAELDALSRSLTARWDRYRRHRVGYGLEASFPPSMTGRLSLSRGDPRVLRPGMVIAFAPYLSCDDQPEGERFAAVFGEAVIITTTGTERLSRIPCAPIRA